MTDHAQPVQERWSLQNCWQAVHSLCSSAGQVNWDSGWLALCVGPDLVACWGKRQIGVQQAHLTKRAAE